MRKLLSEIPGYEDLINYAVDINGVCWSNKSGDWKQLKERVDTKGYHQFSCTRKGKKIYVLVHKLVALAFIHKPDNCTEVNHKNMVKTDNRIDNLEWVSRSENIKHSYDSYDRFRMQGTKSPVAKLDDDKVREIKTLLSHGLSQRSIAKMYGVCHTVIRGIALGNRWPHVT